MTRPAATDPGCHQFGPWRFDAVTGALSDGETTTQLEPQVAKLLDYFLAHQNSLTSRDELIATVWDGRIVSDDAINRCVSILRQILTPDDKNAFIETVVRRGFISHFPPPDTATPRFTRPQGRHRYWFVVILVLAVIVIVFAVSDKTSNEPPELRQVDEQVSPMVAVLPFTTFGPEGSSDFFAAGMHDDLLTQLAQLQSLRVISRTSVLEYQDTSRNIREIGRELGADAILEGGVQRIGDQIRMNVQLIDARSDVHLWAEQFDRNLSPATIFEVQTEIAIRIASALHATLTEQDSTQLAILPTDNMAAYRAFHRAMEIRYNQGFGLPEYGEALEEAVTLDPTFVRAWVELAGWLSYRNFGRKDPDAVSQVEQILERIRSLAPQSGEYLIAQAFFTYYLLNKYDRAFQLISKAHDLWPGDLQVVELKSWIQRRLGDIDGMIESLRLARTLDPKNPLWTDMLVQQLIFAHRYDEAMLEIQNSRQPTFEQRFLGSFLRHREGRDYERQLKTLEALKKEFQHEAHPSRTWELEIAKRDFAAAENRLRDMQIAGERSDAWALPNFPGADYFPMITYWFLQDHDNLTPLLSKKRAFLEEQRDADGKFPDYDHNLEMAFVNAMQGNTGEAERLVRTWRRAATEDISELVQIGHYSCRALGMAGAARATVECIQASLAQPSFMMPFIEPYLPYYDPVRDEPEFIEMLDGATRTSPMWPESPAHRIKGADPRRG